MTPKIDLKYKQYAPPLSRILRERFGHKADVREAITSIEFHFPTIDNYDRLRSIRYFIAGFIAAIEYNSNE